MLQANFAVIGHSEYNQVVICVSHSSKQVRLSAYPAISKNGMLTMLVTDGEYATIEAMPRLNRKRLEALFQMIKDNVAAKCGQGWDVVSRMLSKHSMAMVPFRFGSVS